MLQHGREILPIHTGANQIHNQVPSTVEYVYMEAL